MNRCEDIFPDKPFGYDNGILEVVAVPRHERHLDVAPQRKLATVSRLAVRDDRAFRHILSHSNDRNLVDACVLVGTVVLRQIIYFHRRLLQILRLCAYGYPACVHTYNRALFFRDNNRARVFRRDRFHPRSYKRSFRFHQRDSLTLHIGPHQSSVCVIVLKERDQCRGHRHKLLW